jgi:predicted HicB family RNase H-like nuclease
MGKIAKSVISRTILYKEYVGEYGFTADGSLIGQVMGLTETDLSFKGDDENKLKADFERVIDEYLADCESKNIKPETPFKGSFNVRIGPDRHAFLAHVSLQEDKTLNKTLIDAVDHYRLIVNI